MPLFSAVLKVASWTRRMPALAGSGSGPGAGVDDLLQETGDHLLAETGDAILLDA